MTEILTDSRITWEQIVLHTSRTDRTCSLWHCLFDWGKSNSIHVCLNTKPTRSPCRVMPSFLGLFSAVSGYKRSPRVWTSLDYSKGHLWSCQEILHRMKDCVIVSVLIRLSALKCLTFFSTVQANTIAQRYVRAQANVMPQFSVPEGKQQTAQRQAILLQRFKGHNATVTSVLVVSDTGTAYFHCSANYSTLQAYHFLCLCQDFLK